MRKGQKAPEEMIIKKKYAEWKKFSESIDISPWEKYADLQMEYQKNKTTKVFTLREYYILIKSGKTGIDLIDDGYSPTLVRFYNGLLKNEINLTKKRNRKRVC